MKVSALAELSIFPVGKGESVSEYVAQAVRVIQESGVPFSLGPMGTCFEAEIEEVFEISLRCMKAVKRDCPRVYMVLKI